MDKNKQMIFFISSIIGFILFSIPLLFLNLELLSGICCILGIISFLVASRLIDDKKHFFIFLLILWLSISIRFSKLLGTDIKYSLLLSLALLSVAIVFGIGIKIEHFLKTKKLYFVQVLVFPIVYTIFMIVAVLLGLGNCINVMTYLMCIPKFNNNLRWLGEYGLTFIYSLILSLITNIIIVKKSREKILTLVPICIIMLTLFVGAISICVTKTDYDYELNVAVATHEKMDFFGNREKEITKEERYEIFNKAVKEASANNADLLVLDEEFCQIEEDDYDEAIEYYTNVIKANNIPVLVCIDILKENDLCVNACLFFDNNGNILATYLKKNLVPFIEAGYYERGTTNPEYLTYDFNGRSVNISLALCFDIDNSFFMNKVNDNTELLLVPSWDWDNCCEEQKRTRIRSVEINTTILKHTFSGYTYVSGPYGMIGDYIDNRDDFETVKMVTIPIWEKDNK